MVSTLLFQNILYDSISGDARKSPVCKIVVLSANLKKNITAPGQLLNKLKNINFLKEMN